MSLMQKALWLPFTQPRPHRPLLPSLPHPPRIPCLKKCCNHITATKNTSSSSSSISPSSAAPVAVVGVGRVNDRLPGLARGPWLEVVRKVREDRIDGTGCTVVTGDLSADADGCCLHLHERISQVEGETVERAHAGRQGSVVPVGVRSGQCSTQITASKPESTGTQASPPMIASRSNIPNAEREPHDSFRNVEGLRMCTCHSAQASQGRGPSSASL